MKNVNNIKRGPMANCIALHDFAIIPENIKAWFDYTVDFFRAHGIEPTRMDSQKTDKTVSLKIGIKQLEDIDYQADGMWMGATPPNHGDDTFDSIFSTSFSYEWGHTLVLCFDDQIVGFDQNIMHTLARDLSSFFGARYGYAYQRKFSQGPDFYPDGVIGGNDTISDEEENQITRWGNHYSMSPRKYKTGQLRDIYPYNFISQAHFDEKVGDQTLREWIEKDPIRGTLAQVTDTLWSWQVDASHIESVRAALAPTGIIICV
jgi:hypothetical protein